MWNKNTDIKLIKKSEKIVRKKVIIEHWKCQLIPSMALAVPSARLAQACCLVSLPYYEGYNRFAVWPAPNSVSRFTKLRLITILQLFFFYYLEKV